MSQYRYFTISHGLRGCFMPDNDPYVIAVKTRRELRRVIEDEAHMIDSGRTQGFSKRMVAGFVAICWREAQKKRPAYLPYVLGYKEPEQKYYSSAIFVSTENRAAYVAYLRESDNA